MDISLALLSLIIALILPAAFATGFFLGKRRLKKAFDRAREDINHLRNGEEKYLLLAENISEVIFLLDLATLRYTYVSPSIFRTHGWTPEEAINITIDRHITPSSLEFVYKTIAQELEQDGRSGVDPDRYITMETEQYHKDGSTLWVETICKPIRDESGNIKTVIGVARDITHRKKTETARRESENQYRLLADNINLDRIDSPQSIDQAIAKVATIFKSWTCSSGGPSGEGK